MKALGMFEVYSFTTAVCAADAAAKAADVQIAAFDRNRPVKTDVPAPLVMEVKLTGDVSAVQAAVEAGCAYAQRQGRLIVSHVIAHPDSQTEKLAYRMDINRDKFNKKLPKSFVGNPPARDLWNGALGFLEVQGLVASIAGLDAMAKAADVRLVHTEKRLGGRLVTLVITGTVSSVRAAVEAGKAAAQPLGQVYSAETIARPDCEITKFFDMA